MNSNFKIEQLENPINWIDEMIDENSKPNYVNGLLPNVYTNYFKLYFPVGLTNATDNTSIPKTYKEIASIANLDYASNFSYMNLVKKFGGIPSNFVIIKENDEVFIDKFVNIFGSDTNVIFEDIGDDIYPEEFEVAWKIEGKLELLKDIFIKLNKDNYHDFNYFPTYIYAKDKSWCTATKIFQSGLIVLGCNKILADKIQAQNIIDFQEIKYGDEYFEFINQ